MNYTSVKKILLRGEERSVIGGVCIGISRYFGIPTLLVRFAFFILIIPGGLGIFIYIFLWIAIPEESIQYIEDRESEDLEGNDNFLVEKEHIKSRRIIVGVFLASTGGVILVNNIFSWFSARDFWPLIFVGIGIFLLVEEKRDRMK